MAQRKSYSKEFKHEALRRADEEGVTNTLAAEEMGFSTRSTPVLSLQTHKNANHDDDQLDAHRERIPGFDVPGDTSKNHGLFD
jgi:transposase-like protein